MYSSNSVSWTRFPQSPGWESSKTKVSILGLSLWTLKWLSSSNYDAICNLRWVDMMWIKVLFMHFVNSVSMTCTILMNFTRFKEDLDRDAWWVCDIRPEWLPKCMSTRKIYLRQPTEKIGSFDKLTVLIVQFDNLGEVNLQWRVSSQNLFKNKDRSRPWKLAVTKNARKSEERFSLVETTTILESEEKVKIIMKLQSRLSKL